MENAQLITLSRQVALRRQMDVVANNLANVTTSGFKQQNILFEEFVMPVARNRDSAAMNNQVSFVQDWATMNDLSQGSVEQTGNPLDVALQGEGFLAVQTPAGERWTRAGALQIDANGTLVTTDGHAVMGDGGAINFDPTETDITIDSTGAIATNAGAKGRLRIVEFAEPRALAREGDNLYSGGEPAAAVDTRVMQGAIERSNVSGVRQITEMIRVQRAYESLASLVQRQDDIRQSAIQRLGNLNA